MAAGAEFLTPEEIARTLSVSSQSVRRWIAVGQLNAYRVGGRLRVNRTDFLRFLDGGRRQADPAEKVVA